MWLRALKSWINWDCEGVVLPEQIFEANEYRCRDLVRLGHAVVVMGPMEKIKVPSDPPQRVTAKGRTRKGAPLPSPNLTRPRQTEP